MLDLMQKEFGLVVNIVNAGKCGSVRNWYEPPGGTWVTARRRIRGENVLVMLLKNVLWRVTGGDFWKIWVKSQQISFHELSEHTNIGGLRIYLWYDLGVSAIREEYCKLYFVLW